MSSDPNSQSSEMWQKSCFLTKLIAASVKISEAAGRIIKNTAVDANLHIINKSTTGGRDPQTVADRKSQYVIFYSLRKIFGDELKIIGEEGESMEETDLEESVSDYVLSMDNKLVGTLRDISPKDVVVWVDPLDGTKEYTSGIESKRSHIPEVTVLIGIAYKGEAYAGVIHQPFFNSDGASRTVWGLKGLGYFGIPKVEVPKTRLVVSSHSHSSTTIDDTLNTIRSKNLIDNVEKVGGAGNKVLRCLTDAAAYIYPSLGTKKWDTCAPEAVLASAGGMLTDISGRSLRYTTDIQRMNSAGVIATAPWMKDVHEDIINSIPQSIKDKLTEHIS